MMKQSLLTSRRGNGILLIFWGLLMFAVSFFIQDIGILIDTAKQQRIIWNKLIREDVPGRTGHFPLRQIIKKPKKTSFKTFFKKLEKY